MTTARACAVAQGKIASPMQPAEPVERGVRPINGLLVLSERPAGVMAVTTLGALLSRIPGSTPVCVGTYLRDLCADLAKAFGRSSGPQLTCAAVDAALPIGTVITLGLIADLLITNAFIAAFGPGSGGRIAVSFTAEPEGWHLTVEDSGVVIQAADSGRDNGLIIVRLLISRLGGCLEVPESIKGTRCIVTVPCPARQA